MYRDHTKTVKIGDRVIGGGNPILIQSMTNTRTEDVEATVAQIRRLEAAGCEIVRCTVPTQEAAVALRKIKTQIRIPMVADIHFDYRMAMGIPECWFRLVRDVRDEDWSVGFLWHELTNRRADEQTVSYVESHDQALVGGKSFIFQMLDKEMYGAMHKGSVNLTVDRGLALHKMARLATLGCCCAYLNFMGNEFGHPEWIDFPREGNGNSYHHARRQWSLRDDPTLRFKGLADFDEAMLHLMTKERVLEDTIPCRIYASDEDKVLAFMRGEFLFVFNFHSEHSLADYPVIVPPGHYHHELDTDAEAFGGFARIQQRQEYPMTTVKHEDEICFAIRLYLPARTAIIIRRTPPKRGDGKALVQALAHAVSMREAQKALDK